MASSNSFHPLTSSEDWEKFLHTREVLEWRELEVILERISREEKLGMLKRLLKPGTEITIALTEDWLHRLLMFNSGVLAEAERLKARLPALPWHALRAAERGDVYWLKLAQSYGGD